MGRAASTMRTKSYLQHALFADTAIDEYNEPHCKDPETGAMGVLCENKDPAHNSVKDSRFVRVWYAELVPNISNLILQF